MGLVTGRRSRALVRRCEDLGISMLIDGTSDKATALDRICDKAGISASRAAFMGDDLPDLPIMRRTGCAIAVADAHPVVRQQADIITNARGGQGAVREICEMILKAKGSWEELLERYN